MSSQEASAWSCLVPQCCLVPCTICTKIPVLQQNGRSFPPTSNINIWAFSFWIGRVRAPSSVQDFWLVNMPSAGKLFSSTILIGMSKPACNSSCRQRKCLRSSPWLQRLKRNGELDNRRADGDGDCSFVLAGHEICSYLRSLRILQILASTEHQSGAEHHHHPPPPFSGAPLFSRECCLCSCWPQGSPLKIAVSTQITCCPLSQH